MAAPMFDTFSDEQLVAFYRQQADVCVGVQAMPAEQRTAVGKKGACSPEQAAATLNVFAIFHTERELVRRGLITEEQACIPA